MNSKYKIVTEEYLDERWDIYIGCDKREPDKIAYETALKTIELMGFNWTRKEGKHKLIKKVV